MGRELRQRRLGSKVVNSAGITLWIDPADLQGRNLFAGGGVVGTKALAIWRRLIDDFRPTVIIDVGANYGEVALSHRHGPNVPVHLVEANPRLVKILAKTIRPLNGVTLHMGAASDKPGTCSAISLEGKIGSLINQAKAKRGIDQGGGFPTRPANRSRIE